MGMFDYVRCKYPLPVEGANALLFQTKDTPAQYMDEYEIREDGTLWGQEYDTEDHSDRAKWMAAHPGETPPDTLDPFCGCASRVNVRPIHAPITTTLNFYTFWDDGLLNTDDADPGWIEFSAHFALGKLIKLDVVKNRPASSAPEARDNA